VASRDRAFQGDPQVATATITTESSRFRRQFDGRSAYGVREALIMTPSRIRLGICAVSLATLAAAVAMPSVLGHRLGLAVDTLGGASRPWLAAATLAFGLAFCAGVAAWRVALAAAGAPIGCRQAGARIGIGCLVNSVAPAKLGDAVKLALCAKAADVPDRLWTAGGIYAALAAARTLVLVGLVAVGWSVGALPAWPLAALIGALGVLSVAAALSSRLRNHPHLTHFLSAVRTLTHDRRLAVAMLTWTTATAVARLVATGAVAAALGVNDPALAALLILPALDLAGAFPLTPGAVGIGSGAVAGALATRGISAPDALATGLAIQGLETLVSLAAGVSGGLYLTVPGPVARRWTTRVAVVGGTAVLAAVLGSVVLELT
jgi:uncharacterized membrane protein YbhN (UPF0104 family)